jgi:putative ABC transport system ATP-binding protein
MDHLEIITFSNVSFGYAGGQPLFKGLSLAFVRGRFYLVQGPSGAGKSTLLRLMSRLEEPTAGTILFRARPLPTYAPPGLRKSVLYIHQTPTVLDGSVGDNLLLPFGFASNKDRTPPDRGQLRRLLDDFLLQDIDLEDNAQALSVGQRQRVCFIRGMLLSPQVLLLDEPASALDRESSRLVEGAAARLCQESGTTVVMVSHREFGSEGLDPTLLRVEGQGIREIPWNRR